MAIYGSFVGDETSREPRYPQFAPSVLSGDIGTADDNSDNSYHVVIGNGTDNSAILDGFIITAGNANGDSLASLQAGGGMYNDLGSPSIRSVIFRDNYATFGGGMYTRGDQYSYFPTAPALNHVDFINNSAKEGGGMRNESYTSATLTDVTFDGNQAVRSGGGMENFDHNDIILVDVTFHNNTTKGSGGGLMNWSHNNPQLTNVTFSGNAAVWGGGISNYLSNPVLTNVIMNDNSATTYGGGISNESSSPTLTNVTISGNRAATNGGGIFNDNTSNPTLTNVTISGNKANSQGGGVYNQGGHVSIRNGILYGDIGGEIQGAADAIYSIVQGGYPGLGNLDSDPLLGPVQDNGGPTLTMALAGNSPAIDAGNHANCPDTDQRGMTRPQGEGCDIGAFEYRHEIHYVKFDAVGMNDGTSWMDAF